MILAQFIMTIFSVSSVGQSVRLLTARSLVRPQYRELNPGQIGCKNFICPRGPMDKAPDF